MKTDCVPTENGPSRFDWVWYIVWFSADASVMYIWHGTFTFYPEISPNLQLKIPTNLAPSSAQKIRHI